MHNKKINILIIDNHNSNENDFIEIFKGTSVNIYLADGIENGIEIASRYLPDIIICSISTLEHGKKLIENIFSEPEIRFIPIIYISALGYSTEEYREIMNLGVADYFPKNFHPSDLVKSVKIRVKLNSKFKSQLTEKCQRAFEIENQRKKDHILITVGKKLQLIKFEDIVCITSEKEYSKIKMLKGKSLIVRKSLKNWLEVLPPNIFLRIHRHSIINVNFIEKIEKVKLRTYAIYLKTLTKPLELSRRYSYLMKKTFSGNDKI